MAGSCVAVFHQSEEMKGGQQHPGFHPIRMAASVTWELGAQEDDAQLWGTIIPLVTASIPFPSFITHCQPVYLYLQVAFCSLHVE